MVWDGRLQADARHLPIADASVQCVVTSPPYWGLRDYGVDQQIGKESTVQEYKQSIAAVFLEMWRVLKNDGTVWLNIGDCYYSGNRGGYHRERTGVSKNMGHSGSYNDFTLAPNRTPQVGLKDKDLVGMPWEIAFMLRDGGWYLRSDIIWAKKNCMPESVTDRLSRAHEYLFLLAKQKTYYYDADAIKELCDPQNSRDTTTRRRYPGQAPDSGFKAGRHFETRNKRDVWWIGTQPYREAHYATFPTGLVEPCILAGSRVGDIVLDPFFGSGTVGRVAERFSRRWIGCDLRYFDLQAKRLTNIQREMVELL